MAGVVCSKSVGRLILLAIMLFSYAEGNQSTLTESQFISNLLMNYNNVGRPGLITQPLTVYLELLLINLDEFNERDQYITTLCWFRQRWKDESLSWNATEMGLKAISVDGSFIWRPNIVVRNSKEDVYGDVLDQDNIFKTRIFSDGMVQVLTAGKISTACIVDMTYFPFDRQACYILFDSWTLSIEELRLEASDLGDAFNMDSYRPNGQWRVNNHYMFINTTYYAASAQSFDEAWFVVELERKPEFYLLNIVAPCVIMSAMVILVFVVPVDSGEKVSLCVTLFLAYSVFQLVVADHMPRSSDNFPILGLYFTMSMVLAGLSLLATLVVLNVRHHGMSGPPPRCLRRILQGRLPALLGLPPPPHTLADKSPPSAGHEPLIGKADQQELQAMGDVEQNGNTSDGELGELKTEVTKMRRSLQNLRSAVEGVERRGSSGSGDEQAEVTGDDWLYIARVMDRVFLVIFAICTVLMAVILLGLVPLGRPVNVRPVNVS